MKRNQMKIFIINGVKLRKNWEKYEKWENIEKFK